MAIPYLLMGNIAESGTWLRKGPGHFEALADQAGAGPRHAGGHRRADRRRWTTASSCGSTRLLIATGSSPIRPPIPGIDLPGVHPCWTLDDARKIMGLAVKGARVLQMGAGFIGCIIMEALAARGVHLSVVEMGDRMVPRMMGPTAGGMIKDWCEKKGVEVFTGTRVEAIEAAHAAVGAAVERPAGAGRPRDQRHRRAGRTSASWRTPASAACWAC